MPRTRPRRVALSRGPRRWVGAVALSLTLLAGSPAAVATASEVTPSDVVEASASLASAGTGLAGGNRARADGLDLRDEWLHARGLAGGRAPASTAVGTASHGAASDVAGSDGAASDGSGDDLAARAAWRYPDGMVPVTTCDERLCVHRVTTGRHAATAAWADQALAFFDAAWSEVVDELGYRAPRSAQGHDGDERFDVYLADLSSRDQHGWCAPGDLVPGQTRRADSYCVIDNDMAGTDGDRHEVLAATAAHEFFHAVQYNLDVAEDRWFMEASATWMEHQVFSQVHDNHRYLPEGQLGSPARPLDSEAGMYGNWVFVQHLADRFGRDAVRQVWSRLDASTGGRDEWSLQGLVNHVGSRGESWKAFYTGFASANLAPGRWYSQRGLRAARPDLVVRLGRHERRSLQRARVAHLATRTYEVRVASGTPSRRVQLRVRSDRARATAATLLVVRTDGSVRRERLTFTRGVATAGVTLRPGRVRKVLVAVSHTSPTYARCGRGSGWSCGGEPVHREVRVRFRAQLR